MAGGTVMSSSTKRRTGWPRIAALWTIIDELPDPLPVGKPELDALERHFNSILEQCLAGKAGTATVIQSDLGRSERVGRSGRKQVGKKADRDARGHRG